MALFAALHVFSDDQARNGAGQMAIDQALLETVSVPVLRLYRWSEPSISFGYSQSVAGVRQDYPGYPLVRRWTGGGVVEHTGDYTFAVVCPLAEPFALVRPVETYRQIHTAVVAALARESIPARLVASEESLSGPACFTAPTTHDVFDSVGQKICGGAQRRTRQGFLHQGSLQKVMVSPAFSQILASCLAETVLPFASNPALEARTDALVASRYSTRDWLELIS